MSIPEEDGPGLGRILEPVKRAVVLALRDAIDINLPADDELRKVINNISLDYPSTREAYPGLWVNLSFTRLQRASLNPEFRTTDDGRRFMLWSFDARVTINIAAVKSSLIRDRISDAVVEMLAFQDLSPAGRVFWQRLNDMPGIWFTANKDEIIPSGQTVTVGTPWLDSELVYEDAYSFNLSGQFGSDIETGQTTILSDIIWSGQMTTDPDYIDTAPSDGNGAWS